MDSFHICTVTSSWGPPEQPTHFTCFCTLSCTFCLWFCLAEWFLTIRSEPLDQFSSYLHHSFILGPPPPLTNLHTNTFDLLLYSGLQSDWLKGYDHYWWIFFKFVQYLHLRSTFDLLLHSEVQSVDFLPLLHEPFHGFFFQICTVASSWKHIWLTFAHRVATWLDKRFLTIIAWTIFRRKKIAYQQFQHNFALRTAPNILDLIGWEFSNHYLIKQSVWQWISFILVLYIVLSSQGKGSSELNCIQTLLTHFFTQKDFTPYSPLGWGPSFTDALIKRLEHYI